MFFNVFLVFVQLHGTVVHVSVGVDGKGKQFPGMVEKRPGLHQVKELCFEGLAGCGDVVFLPALHGNAHAALVPDPRFDFRVGNAFVVLGYDLIKGEFFGFAIAQTAQGLGLLKDPLYDIAMASYLGGRIRVEGSKAFDGRYSREVVHWSFICSSISRASASISSKEAAFVGLEPSFCISMRA